MLPSLPPGIAHAFENAARRVVTDKVMPRAMAKDPTDTGCCVSLWVRVHDPEPHWVYVCTVRIGELTEEKSYKYAVISMEKGHRLIANPDHILSFESRGNEEDADWMKRRYPGAARMDEYEIVISTSGFDWCFDELVDILIGYECSWISNQHIQRIIALSDNQEAHLYFLDVG